MERCHDTAGDHVQQRRHLAQLNFQTQFGTNYNLAFASYLLALIPILIFYIFCQKQIIGGIANGAVKG
jgi:raffinose/stachyose/melibiose transport system permease protein